MEADCQELLQTSLQAFEQTVSSHLNFYSITEGMREVLPSAHNFLEEKAASRPVCPLPNAGHSNKLSLVQPPVCFVLPNLVPELLKRLICRL